jgi:hypothetical protein
MGHKHNKLMFPISNAFAAFGLASFIVVVVAYEMKSVRKFLHATFEFFIWNGSKRERVLVVIKFYEKDDISELLTDKIKLNKAFMEVY